jgi:carboxylesterase type B
VPYAFDTLDATKSVIAAGDREYAQRVSGYWLAFARTGRPAPAAGWPSHTRRQDRTMIFADRIETRSNFMRTRLNVFLGVSRIAGRILDRK